MKKLLVSTTFTYNFEVEIPDALVDETDPSTYPDAIDELNLFPVLAQPSVVLGESYPKEIPFNRYSMYVNSILDVKENKIVYGET